MYSNVVYYSWSHKCSCIFLNINKIKSTVCKLYYNLVLHQYFKCINLSVIVLKCQFFSLLCHTHLGVCGVWVCELCIAFTGLVSNATDIAEYLKVKMSHQIGLTTLSLRSEKQPAIYAFFPYSFQNKNSPTVHSKAGSWDFFGGSPWQTVTDRCR